MTDRLKNILIGSFVAVAMLIAVSFIVFLKPTIGDGKKTLYVRFANIAGINTGTRVTYAGKPVGEVRKIRLVPNARLNATDETGRVYSYQLILRIDSSIDIYTTDDIAIRTTGLMGEKSIAILPKAGHTGQLASHETILYANSTDPLENTFSQIGRVAAKVEGIAFQFDTWFQQNKENLGFAAESFTSAAQSLDSVLTALKDHNVIPSLHESIDLVSDNLRFLRTSLNEDQLLTRLSTLAAELTSAAEFFNSDGAEALSNLSQISRDIATGTGTVGRFVKGDDFYLRIAALMNKADTLMNDVNHYGLLFQYDKHWQRSRTKKANILKALDTPEEFKTFFEGEMDSINTSLGRITELLGRASEVDEREKILQDDGFKKDFASLLRKVQSLSDAVKLYNQEIIAQNNRE